MAEADPLILLAKNDYEIFDARITQTKNPANLFTVVLEKDSKARIRFDYIDRNEGAIIQLIHTGRSSDDIEFVGTIKGVGRLGRRLRQELVYPVLPFRLGTLSNRSTSYALGALCVLLGIVIPAIALWLTPRSLVIPELYYLEIIVCSVMVILYCGVGIFLLRNTRRIPSGFDAFETEF